MHINQNFGHIDGGRPTIAKRLAETGLPTIAKRPTETENLSENQDQQLGSQDAQEHGQGIDRGIAHGGSIG